MPQAEITHRVDVRRHAAQKRAALAAHRTQVSGRGRAARLFRSLVRMPLPVFRIFCGTECFTEPGDGRVNLLLVIRRPVPAEQISAQLQQVLTEDSRPAARVTADAKSWPKSGQGIPGFRRLGVPTLSRPLPRRPAPLPDAIAPSGSTPGMRIIATDPLPKDLRQAPEAITRAR